SSVCSARRGRPRRIVPRGNERDATWAGCRLVSWRRDERWRGGPVTWCGELRARRNSASRNVCRARSLGRILRLSGRLRGIGLNGARLVRKDESRVDVLFSALLVKPGELVDTRQDGRFPIAPAPGVGLGPIVLAGVEPIELSLGGVTFIGSQLGRALPRVIPPARVPAGAQLAVLHGGRDAPNPDALVVVIVKKIL